MMTSRKIARPLAKRPGTRIALATLSLLSTLAWITPSIAGEYPDRSGQCYFFRGETLELQEECKLSTGYGAGAQYVILNWSDGVKTKIFNLTVCKEGGNCGSTVDDAKATLYSRDLFLNPTDEKDEQEITCYAIQNNNNSVCYRFQS
jgi:hypothetical protein